MCSQDGTYLQHTTTKIILFLLLLALLLLYFCFGQSWGYERDGGTVQSNQQTHVADLSFLKSCKTIDEVLGQKDVSNTQPQRNWRLDCLQNTNINTNANITLTCSSADDHAVAGNTLKHTSTATNTAPFSTTLPSPRSEGVVQCHRRYGMVWTYQQ